MDGAPLTLYRHNNVVFYLCASRQLLPLVYPQCSSCAFCTFVRYFECPTTPQQVDEIPTNSARRKKLYRQMVLTLYGGPDGKIQTAWSIPIAFVMVSVCSQTAYLHGTHGCFRYASGLQLMGNSDSPKIIRNEWCQDTYIVYTLV
jgi:hypothetical protein